MLFNSIAFLVFFGIFFLLYWIVFDTVKTQNRLLLAGSYFFYAWWDWRFLFLLIGSSLLHFILANAIQQTQHIKRRKIYLLIGLVEAIGVLVVFKYAGFFIDSFINAFASIGISLGRDSLLWILPLGLSFYSFRLIGYLLDVYNEKFTAVKEWVVFFSFVSFFPCLVSGPIDKAKKIIPQLETARIFSYGKAVDGLRQICWGLFKKLVVANNCAVVVASVFSNYQHLPGSSLLIGIFFYAIQIYADFSGYSDMALGFARLIGFEVTRNFDFPFFSTNIAMYWRKWHISLTAWLTEYVFTPISIRFRDLGKTGLLIAILINFILVGAWHGANLTFVVFGFLHGCYFIPLILRGKLSGGSKKAKAWAAIDYVKMCGVFVLVSFTFVVFMADSLSLTVAYYERVFSSSVFSIPVIPDKKAVLISAIYTIVLLIIEWFGQRDAYAIEKLPSNWHISVRWPFYYALTLLILLYSQSQQGFIYARF